MRRKKLLHLISDSAHSAYFRSWATLHDRSQFDMTIGTLDSGGVLTEDTIARDAKVLMLGARSRRDYPRVLSSLVRFLRRERIDILQTHLFDASLVGLTAAKIARTPVTIFSGHHSSELVMPLGRPPNRIAFWGDVLATRVLSDRIIVHTAEMRDQLAAVEGVPREKISVVHLGFDLGLWRNVTGRDRVRAELGVDGKIVLGAVGRMHWIKAYPNLLRAFARVARDRDDLRLVIIGSGPEYDAVVRANAELPTANKVIFTGHRADIQAVVSAMDLFVHASLTESFGQIIIEALAAGKPIVSTATGIAREVITNDIGVLVPPGDDAALARGISDMLARRDEWPAMGRAAVAAAADFSADRMIAEHQRLYLEWYAATEL